MTDDLRERLEALRDDVRRALTAWDRGADTTVGELLTAALAASAPPDRPHVWHKEATREGDYDVQCVHCGVEQDEEDGPCPDAPAPPLPEGQTGSDASSLRAAFIALVESCEEDARTSASGCHVCSPYDSGADMDHQPEHDDGCLLVAARAALDSSPQPAPAAVQAEVVPVASVSPDEPSVTYVRRLVETCHCEKVDGAVCADCVVTRSLLRRMEATDAAMRAYDRWNEAEDHAAPNAFSTLHTIAHLLRGDYWPAAAQHEARDVQAGSQAGSGADCPPAASRKDGGE